MGPLVEGVLGLLLWLRRVSVLVLVGSVVVLLWLAARRAGRKGLELAVLLVGAALAAFTIAVFVPRPPMTEGAAVALVLVAAFLIVATAGIILWFGVRRRKPPKIIGHRTPPWENGGW